MIVKDNPEIQQQVRRLTRVLEEAIEQIRYLDKLADSRYEEVDAVDEVVNFDNIIFNMRAVMFNAKIELEKVQKAMHKHISHTLNPIAKTAPKSARKTRGESKTVNMTIVKQDSKTTTYINGNKVDEIMNAIMPGKDGHHPAKHSTINKKNIIPKGNHYQGNPAHDKPFDESDN